jgi:hypothetical protein
MVSPTLVWWFCVFFRFDSFDVPLISLGVDADSVVAGGVLSDRGDWLGDENWGGGMRIGEGVRGRFAGCLMTVSRYFLQIILGIRC